MIAQRIVLLLCLHQNALGLKGAMLIPLLGLFVFVSHFLGIDTELAFTLCSSGAREAARKVQSKSMKQLAQKMHLKL